MSGLSSEQSDLDYLERQIDGLDRRYHAALARVEEVEQQLASIRGLASNLRVAIGFGAEFDGEGSINSILFDAQVQAIAQDALTSILGLTYPIVLGHWRLFELLPEMCNRKDIIESFRLVTQELIGGSDGRAHTPTEEGAESPSGTGGAGEDGPGGGEGESVDGPGFLGTYISAFTETASQAAQREDDQ